MRISILAAAGVLALAAHASPETDKWALRYLKAAEADNIVQTQVDAVSRRMALVARRCDARVREVGLFWILAYRAYLDDHKRGLSYWNADEPPSVSPLRFVVLFNFVIADAYEANGNRPLSRTACLDELAELAEDPDQLNLSVGHLILDDDETRP